MGGGEGAVFGKEEGSSKNEKELMGTDNSVVIAEGGVGGCERL